MNGAKLEVSPLPPHGVEEVLIQAAATYPLVTLLAVLILIGLAFCVSGWAAVKIKQLDVMRSPEAARAMVELKKLDNVQKRLADKAKKAKS